MSDDVSAAIASHLACDLSKTARHPDRPRLRAVALTDNVGRAHPDRPPARRRDALTLGVDAPRGTRTVAS